MIFKWWSQITFDFPSVTPREGTDYIDLLQNDLKAHIDNHSKNFKRDFFVKKSEKLVYKVVCINI